MSDTSAEMMARLQPLIGREVGPVYGWDPVNPPMVRQWCEAMGNRNPIFTDAEAARAAGFDDIVAPPTMLQVWVMAGVEGKLPPGSSEEDPYAALKLLEEYGYPAVVAVNCEQDYLRYLRMGDRLHRFSKIESVSEQKSTGLGVGYFVTELISFFDQAGEPVATMRFRLFKYRPHQAPKPVASAAGSAIPKITRPRPGISQDTQFFWDGLKQGQLLIQRCAECGRLRHPPGPVCAQCHSFAWDTLQASGRGVVYSFVVMHYPEVPPFEYPNPVALIELEEGTRLVGQLLGIKAADVRIGMPVQVEFIQDDDLSLAAFRPVSN